MAFSVMDVLRGELKLRVPQDVSVVGYDDVPEAGWGGYALTTVSQSSEDMARATVDILMDQIEAQTVRRKAAILPARLVVRSSARVPKPR